jgi:class 3 adenylate cyclase
VNLASRLVNIARPGSVLASDELGAQLAASANLGLRHLRGEHLKGIGRVRVWVVREKPS